MSSLHHVSWVLVALVLLASLTGCPPVREDGVDDGTGGGSSLRTALVASDPWTGDQYELLYVYLVDQDHTCEQILVDYGLSWWSMSNEVSWVTFNVYKGQSVDWESTFRSQASWTEDGQWDYTAADFFSGSFGTGGYGSDDDDAYPPPPDDEPEGTAGRDQEGNIGLDMVGLEDSLTIHSWDGETLRGDVEAAAGSWSFNATYCGELDGEVVGIPEGGDVDGAGAMDGL